MRQMKCPLCGAPADRAISGVFPLWICTKCEPDSCVPFGFWFPVLLFFGNLFDLEGFSFLVCDNPTFLWYFKSLKRSLLDKD